MLRKEKALENKLIRFANESYIVLCRSQSPASSLVCLGTVTITDCTEINGFHRVLLGKNGTVAFRILTVRGAPVLWATWEENTPNQGDFFRFSLPYEPVKF